MKTQETRGLDFKFGNNVVLRMDNSDHSNNLSARGLRSGGHDKAFSGFVQPPTIEGMTNGRFVCQR